MKNPDTVLQYLQTLSERLSAAITADRRTAGTIFKEAGVSLDYVRNIRRAAQGKIGPYYPKEPILRDLARVLEVSLEYLQGLTDDPSVDVDDLIPRTPKERETLKIVRELEESGRQEFIYKQQGPLRSRLHAIAGDIRALAFQYPHHATELIDLGDEFDQEIDRVIAETDNGSGTPLN